MKIAQTDGSQLMEVADAKIVNGRIIVTGKIMGAMPMKAVVEPAEARKLMRQLGLRRLVAMGWLVLITRSAVSRP